MAKIYRKQTNRPFTGYQKVTSGAEQEICVKNPTLLLTGRCPFEAAKDAVDSTYNFNNGKSRAKKIQDI